jgi:hypothetical protein
MWAFPKRKPQWFATSPAALAMITLSYPVVRNVPRFARVAAVGPLALPVTRRAWVRRSQFSLPSGESAWQRIRDALVPDQTRHLTWVFFRSQWRVSRFAAMGLDRVGSARAFIAVEPADVRTFHPSFTSDVVRIPELLGEFEAGNWAGRRFEVVPRLSRTPSCAWQQIVAVAEDVSARLTDSLSRPPDLPAHWRPMHGDFTPWNLREDRAGRLWLLDWENAAWAPRGADLMRYAVSLRSVQLASVAELVEAVVRDVPGTDEELAEAGDFWLQHQNFFLDHGEDAALTHGKASDLARGRRERDAFRTIAALSS